MEFLQAGVDCPVIALWLGHESIETTQTYLHVSLPGESSPEVPVENSPGE
jgi:site-specific recombinase XerD